MSPSTDQLLHDRVQSLHGDWLLYQNLFVPIDEQRARAFNRASLFFDDLRRILYYHVVLGVARLMDPPVQLGTNHNLVLLRLQDDLDSSKFPNLKTDLETVWSKIEARKANFDRVRNKLIAHSDLPTAQGQVSQQAPTPAEVSEMLGFFAEYMNIYNVAVLKKVHLYDREVQVGGPQALIWALAGPPHAGGKPH